MQIVINFHHQGTMIAQIAGRAETHQDEKQAGKIFEWNERVQWSSSAE